MQLSELLYFPTSHLRKYVSIILIAILGICSFVTPVSAEEAGVSIKPATIEKTVNPGELKNYSITIENLSSFDQDFYLFTRNIVGVGSGGVPIFAIDNVVSTGFELADWITLSIDEVTIPGGGTVSVGISMNVPESATPGSHFGGVFVSVKPPEIKRSGASVGYQVASIMSIRISGDVVEEASIRQFSTSKYLYGSQNVDFSVRIENSGNVLIKPTGPVEVFNMFGKKIDTFMFNEENPDKGSHTKSVVPAITEQGRENKENIREFNFSWEGEGFGFGRYEVIISPVYGDVGAKKTMSSTVSFWVLPMNIIGPALGVLAVLLLITFIFVRIYISRSLAHIHHGRRVISRRKKGSSTTLLIIVVLLVVTALFLIVLLALFA